MNKEIIQREYILKSIKDINDFSKWQKPMFFINKEIYKVKYMKYFNEEKSLGLINDIESGCFHNYFDYEPPTNVLFEGRVHKSSDIRQILLIASIIKHLFYVHMDEDNRKKIIGTRKIKNFMSTTNYIYDANGNLLHYKNEWREYISKLKDSKLENPKAYMYYIDVKNAFPSVDLNTLKRKMYNIFSDGSEDPTILIETLINHISFISGGGIPMFYGMQFIGHSLWKIYNHDIDETIFQKMKIIDPKVKYYKWVDDLKIIFSKKLTILEEKKVTEIINSIYLENSLTVNSSKSEFKMLANETIMDLVRTSFDSEQEIYDSDLSKEERMHLTIKCFEEYLYILEHYESETHNNLFSHLNNFFEELKIKFEVNVSSFTSFNKDFLSNLNKEQMNKIKPHFSSLLDAYISKSKIIFENNSEKNPNALEVDILSIFYNLIDNKNKIFSEYILLRKNEISQMLSTFKNSEIEWIKNLYIWFKDKDQIDKIAEKKANFLINNHSNNDFLFSSNDSFATMWHNINWQKLETANPIDLPLQYAILSTLLNFTKQNPEIKWDKIENQLNRFSLDKINFNITKYRNRHPLVHSLAPYLKKNKSCLIDKNLTENILKLIQYIKLEIKKKLNKEIEKKLNKEIFKKSIDFENLIKYINICFLDEFKNEVLEITNNSNKINSKEHKNNLQFENINNYLDEKKSLFIEFIKVFEPQITNNNLDIYIEVIKEYYLSLSTSKSFKFKP